jgi:hypothetical protein
MRILRQNDTEEFERRRYIETEIILRYSDFLSSTVTCYDNWLFLYDPGTT